jgi:hypothetical protein
MHARPLCCLPPQALADQHFSRRQLSRWRVAAAAEKQERAAALRGALASNAALLCRAWRAWRSRVREQRVEARQLASAEQHSRRRVLAASWQGWQHWLLLRRRMAARSSGRLLVAALGAWRMAAQAAEKR